MIKRAVKRHGGFKTATVETVIIGGKTDYCAERFGYKREINGISPALTPVAAEPSIKLKDVNYAEYLPICGMSAFLSDGTLALWKSGDGKVKTAGKLDAGYPAAHPCFTDGERQYAVIGGDSIIKINANGETQSEQLGVRLYASVMHCGRLFGCDFDDRYTVRWSGYGINDWTEEPDGAGHVRLSESLGKILNLFSMDGKVVIVREYGVSVLNASGDFRQMRTEQGDLLRLPPVYGNSSVICRGQLWICTRGGMYVYSENSLTGAPFDEIMSEYVPEKPKVVDDRYIFYTAARGNEKCLIEYDAETGACTPFASGCGCQFFTPDGGYCFKGAALSRLAENIDDPDRRWVSQKIDLGTDQTKTLKSLRVEGGGNPCVEIECDGRKLYAYGTGETKFSECGRSFTFKVTGNGTVTRLAAEWEVRK